MGTLNKPKKVVTSKHSCGSFLKKDQRLCIITFWRQKIEGRKNIRQNRENVVKSDERQL